MKTVINGKVLDVKSKDWEFNGKKGVSYSVKVLDIEDKEIRNLKIDSNQALDLKGLIDTENVVKFECSAFAEKLSLKVKEYEEKEIN